MPKIIRFIQNGRTLSANGAGLDLDKPFSTIFDDGTSKFSGGATAAPVTPTVPAVQQPVFDPLSLPDPTVPPPAPPSIPRPQVGVPEVITPERQRLEVPPILESPPGPAPFPVAAPFIKPELVNVRFQDSQEQILGEINAALGPNFSPGAAIRDTIRSTQSTSTLETVQLSRVYENAGGREALAALAESVFEQVFDDVARARFSDLAAIQARTLGEQAEFQYNRSIQSDPTGLTIFTNILLDFVGNNSDALHPEILDMFVISGLIEPTLIDEFKTILQTPVAFKGTADDIERLFDQRGIDLEVAGEAFAGALSPRYQNSDSAAYIPVRALAALESLKTLSSTLQFINQNDMQKIAALRDTLHGDADPNLVLFELTEKEIDLGHRSYRNLRLMTLERFMEALLVLRSDVIIDPSSTVQRTSDKKIAGLTNPAENQWLAMGFNDKEIAELSAFVSQGLLYDSTTQLEDIRERADKQFAAEAIVMETYINEDLPVPKEALKDVSPEFIIDMNLEGPGGGFSLVNLASGTAKGMGGFLLNMGGKTLGKVQGIDEHYGDNLNRGWLSDPNSQRIDQPLDARHGVTLREQLNKDIDEFGAERIPYAGRVIQAPGNTGQFILTHGYDLVVRLNALYSPQSYEELQSDLVKEFDFYKSQGVRVQFKGQDLPDDYYKYRHMVIHPASQEGGKLRRDLTEVFLNATPDEKRAMEDTTPSLSTWVEGKDGFQHLMALEEFIGLVQSGIEISIALDAVSTIQDLIWYIETGSLNVLDIIPVSFAWKLIVWPGVRRAFKVPEAVRASSEFLLRAGDVMEPDDVKLIASLRATRNVLEGEFNGEVKTITRIITEDATEAQITILEKINSSKQLRAIKQEIDEIDAILDNVVTDAATGHKGVQHEALVDIGTSSSGRIEFSTGKSVTDIWKKAKALARTRNIAELEPYLFTQGFVSMRDTEVKISNIFGRIPVLRNLFDKSGEGARRKFVIHTTLETLRDVQHIYSIVGTPTVLPDGSQQTIVERAVQVLTGAREAGKSKNRGEMERFVRNNDIDTGLTEHMSRTLELLGAMNIENFKSLRKDIAIAGNQENVAKLVEAGIKESDIFVTQADWVAKFMEDVGEALARTVGGRYQVSQDIGVALKMQNGINGAASALFLEHPGFLFRNLGSNFAAGALDGVRPWQMAGFNSEIANDFRRIFGAEPISSAFSPSIKTTGQLSDVIGQEDSIFKALIGVNGGHSKGRRALGGGIPFVGGLPGLFVREASATAERAARKNVQMIEAMRFFKQTLTPDLVSEQLRIRFPDLHARLAELDPDGAMIGVLVRSLADGASTETVTILRQFGDLDEAELLARVHPSADDLVRDLGFHGPHINEFIKAKFKTIMSDSVPNAKKMASELDEMKTQLDAAGENMARVFGVPADVHRETMQFYDTMFKAAKDAGMTPKAASDVAIMFTHTLAMRMKGIYQRHDIMLQYLKDPDLYLKHQYGVGPTRIERIKGVTPAIDEFPVPVPKHRQGFTDEFNKFLDEQLPPPLKEDHTRLYRGENSRIGSQTLDPKDQGRFFSSSREGAQGFAQPTVAGGPAGFGSLFYVDVPTSLVDDFVVGTGVGVEYVLPQTLVDGKKIIPDALALSRRAEKAGFGESAIPSISDLVDLTKAENKTIPKIVSAAGEPFQDVDDMLRLGIEGGGRRSLEFANTQESIFSWELVDNILDDVKTVTGDETLIAAISQHSESLQETMGTINNAQSRGRARDTVARRVDPVRSLAREWKENFNVRWNKGELDRNLDEMIEALAEVAPPDLKFVVSSSGNFKGLFHGVRRADVNRALDRAIERGTLQERLFRSERFTNRGSIATFSQEIAAPLGEKPLIVTPAVEAAMTQFLDDYRFLTEQVARRDISAGADDIIAFGRSLDASRRATMQQITADMTKFFAEAKASSRFTSGTTPEQVGHGANVLLNQQVDRLQGFIRRNTERYNEVAGKLKIPETAVDHEVLGALDGRYVWYNQPSEYSQWVAENAPVQSFLNESRPGLVRNARDLNNEFSKARFNIEREVAETNGLPNIETITEKTIEGAVKLNTKEDVLQWANNIKLPAGPIMRPEGWQKQLHEVDTYLIEAKTAVIPDDVNIAPANIGMKDIRGAPSAGVWGRVFQQRPPEGFRAFITSDDFIVDGSKLTERHNRIAVFIRDGTDETEATREIIKLSKVNAKELGSDIKLAEVVEATKLKARRFNPTGYHASWQVITAADAQQMLSKYVKLAEEGDRAALMVLDHAGDQWVKGWPFGGQRVENRRTALGLIPDRLDNMYNQYTNNFVANERFKDISFSMTQAESNELADFLTDFKGDVGKIKEVARTLGSARADWILHDYNNAYDFDFLLRWMGPWHIWPTRTFAKLAVRILENPKLLINYARFSARLAQVNQSLPEWAQDQLPAEYILGPFSSIGGLDLSGGTIDISSIFFANDFVDQGFSTGDPENQNFLGKIFNNYKNALPINPGFVGLLIALGVFGDDVDILQSTLAGPLRPAEMTLTLLNMIPNMPDSFPTQVVFTASDRHQLHVTYATAVMQAALSFGPDSDEVREIGDSWNSWTLNGVPKSPLVDAAKGLLFDKEPDDPILKALMDNGQNKRVVTTASSFLLGSRIALGDAEKRNFFNLMSQLTQVFEDTESMGDFDKRQIIDKFFSEHPSVGLYLNNKNDDERINAVSIAKTMFFGGDAAEIRRKADALRAELPLVESDDPDVRRQRKLELETIDNDEDDAIQIVKQKILELTSIDVDTHPAFNIQYLYGTEEARDIFESGLFQSIPQLGGNDARIASESVVTIMDAAAGLDGVWKPITRENFDDLVAEFQTDYARKTGGKEFPIEFLTVSRFNTFIITDAVTDLKLKIDAVTNVNNFPIFVEGYGYSNAINYEARQAEVNLAMDGLSEDQKVQYELTSNRGRSLEQAVDIVISEFITDATNLYWAPIFRDNFASETERAAAIQHVIDNYKAPTNIDIFLRMKEKFGGFWQNKRGLSDNNIINLIRDRLQNTTLGNLIGIIDGRYAERVSTLEADLSQLEKLERQFEDVTGDDEEAEKERADLKARAATLRGKRTEEDHGEIRHFVTPSGSVVIDREDIESFKRGLSIWEILSDLDKQGISIPLHPVFEGENNPIIDYFKWFRKDGGLKLDQQSILDFIDKEMKDDDLLFDVLAIFRGTPNSDRSRSVKPVDFFNSDGSIQPPVLGVPSAGHSVARLGSRYRLDDLPINVALSPAAVRLKAGLGTLEFSGRFEANLPPNYVWEHMARNGIVGGDVDEIKDFFWSLYEATAPLYGSVYNADIDIAPILVEDEGGEGLPRFRWIKGIEAVLAQIFGFPKASLISGGAATSVIGTFSKPSIPRGITSSGAGGIAAISSRGVGGLPRWEEATRHMIAAFQDGTLLDDLLKNFRNPRHKITRNHMRMLRLMRSTFPIPAAQTFDQWMSALKLMWETASLLPQQDARQTQVNPSGGGRFDTPRRRSFNQFR